MDERDAVRDINEDADDDDGEDLFAEEFEECVYFSLALDSLPRRVCSPPICCGYIYGENNHIGRVSTHFLRYIRLLLRRSDNY